MYINIYIHNIYIYLIFYRLERICCKHVGSAGSGRIRRPSLSFSNLFLQSLDPAASETRSTSEERMRDLEKQISAKKIQFLGSGCTKCCEASFSFYIYPSGSWWVPCQGVVSLGRGLSLKQTHGIPWAIPQAGPNHQAQREKSPDDGALVRKCAKLGASARVKYVEDQLATGPKSLPGIHPRFFLVYHLPIYIYPQKIYLSIYPSIYLSIYPSIHPSIYLSIDRSIYRSIDLSIYLSIFLPIYLST
jgi:hypothetical protein